MKNKIKRKKIKDLVKNLGRKLLTQWQLERKRPEGAVTPTFPLNACPLRLLPPRPHFTMLLPPAGIAADWGPGTLSHHVIVTSLSWLILAVGLTGSRITEETKLWARL